MDKELLEQIFEPLRADLSEMKADVKWLIKKDPVGRMECETCRRECRNTIKTGLKAEIVASEARSEGRIKATRGVPPGTAAGAAILVSCITYILFGK